MRERDAICSEGEGEGWGDGGIVERKSCIFSNTLERLCCCYSYFNYCYLLTVRNS